MVIPLGLPRHKEKALLRALVQDHEVDVWCSILDMEHRHKGTLNGRVTGGQVNIDADADVTRQLQLTFVDESASIRVDSDDGRPALDRMIRVHYKVHVRELDEWIGIPIFTGPITSVERDGEGEVTVEAMGKEYLAQSPAWKTRSFRKGTQRVSIIRTVLRDTGERRLRLPEDGWNSRTKRINNVTKDTLPWNMAQAAARGLHAQLFYDGRGFARLRRRPVRSSFTFTDGDGGSILSTPTTSEGGGEDVFNTVRVIGATPEGKKNPLTFTDSLPASHPHSPQALGRWDVPRHIVDEIEDDTLRSMAEVKAMVARRLREIQLDEQTVTFDALPIPLLEEGDRFVVDAKGVKVNARVSQLSIPLGHDGPMTVGYIARAVARHRSW